MDRKSPDRKSLDRRSLGRKSPDRRSLGRRSFIKSAAGGVAGAALATPALSQGRRELKMVTTWPADSPGLSTTAQFIADQITQATEGRLTVIMYNGGDLVPPLGAFDAVGQGTADMYHGTEYYWQNKDSAFNFFSAIPLGLTANEMNAWIYNGGGQKLWDELASLYNIKPFLAGNTGGQMGGWFNRPINTVDDIAGIKIRMVGLGGDVLRNLGASVVALPGGEIYPAMQAGAIDATEWFGPWNDLAMGFYRVAQYYYYPGFHEPGTAFSCGINLNLWNTLTIEEQNIIAYICMAANSYCYSQFNWNNSRALNALVYEYGAELRRFPETVYEVIGKTAESVVRNVVTTSDMARNIYDSYLTARGELSGWSKISDRNFQEGREQVLSAL